MQALGLHFFMFKNEHFLFSKVLFVMIINNNLKI